MAEGDAERERLDAEIASLIGKHIELDDELWGEIAAILGDLQADLVALAAIGIAASVIGAFYYLKFVKVMFFDDPIREVESESPLSSWVVLALCVAIISPLGYFLTIPLGEWTAQAAASFVAAM